MAASFPTGFGFGAGYGAGVRTGYDIIYPALAPYAKQITDFILGSPQKPGSVAVPTVQPPTTVPNPTSRPSGRGTTTLPQTPVQIDQPSVQTPGRPGRSQPSTAITTNFDQNQLNRNNSNWQRAFKLYKDALRKTSGSKQNQIQREFSDWLNNFPANSNNFYE